MLGRLLSRAGRGRRIRLIDPDSLPESLQRDLGLLDGRGLPPRA